MGIMPENRDRRWRSLFRRYGISADEAKGTQPAEALDQLTQRAKEALLPEGLVRPSEKQRTPRKRAR
ncbi:MAG TPA: hypothetical protein VFB38_23080 [Chthonomonadaceae bacterium]|jgi:hypothetical protein|nr:hypothetical protein [Chthonomonadaceae bacterium]